MLILLSLRIQIITKTLNLMWISWTWTRTQQWILKNFLFAWKLGLFSVSCVTFSLVFLSHASINYNAFYHYSQTMSYFGFSCNSSSRYLTMKILTNPLSALNTMLNFIQIDAFMMLNQWHGRQPHPVGLLKWKFEDNKMNYGLKSY